MTAVKGSKSANCRAATPASGGQRPCGALTAENRARQPSRVCWYSGCRRRQSQNCVM